MKSSVPELFLALTLLLWLLEMLLNLSDLHLPQLFFFFLIIHYFFSVCIFWLGAFIVVSAKQAGGPVVQIPTGRRDGKVSAASNVRPNIVDTSFTMDEMIKLFSSKGLSLVDLATLSGTLFM